MAVKTKPNPPILSTKLHKRSIWKPNVVFHAAVYKHVPLMEENPAQAVLLTFMETKVADLSCIYIEIL
jgi:FlaA1/EpsC-like NDP-sugar epimerase